MLLVGPDVAYAKCVSQAELGSDFLHQLESNWTYVALTWQQCVVLGVGRKEDEERIPR